MFIGTVCWKGSHFLSLNDLFCQISGENNILYFISLKMSHCRDKTVQNWLRKLLEFQPNSKHLLTNDVLFSSTYSPFLCSSYSRKAVVFSKKPTTTHRDFEFEMPECPYFS